MHQRGLLGVVSGQSRMCVETTLVSAILVQDASWTGVFIHPLQWIVDRVCSRCLWISSDNKAAVAH
jgi:hypothetical protein